MPSPITVWRVDLRPGSVRETRGTLSLEPDALVFAAADDGGEHRIQISEIHRAHRTLGSPILMIIHSRSGEPTRTAFYFAQPPPLESASRRVTKRKVRRQSATYLGWRNKELKDRIKDWERAVREKVSEKR